MSLPCRLLNLKNQLEYIRYTRQMDGWLNPMRDDTPPQEQYYGRKGETNGDAADTLKMRKMLTGMQTVISMRRSTLQSS